MAILNLSLNIKSIVKSKEMKKHNLLEKEIHVRNLRLRNQLTFTKFREIYTTVKMMAMKKID